MFFDKPFARLSVPAIALVMLFAAAGFGQDPSGRPTDTKGKKPPAKKPGKTEPQPLTVTLTVLTQPPGSEVYVNGEQRGVTNSEGKVQFEKLTLGHYSVEVRKEGYRPMLRGFDAGTEAPTLVFKLEAKLDDSVKEFNSLVAAGKLAGPETPNAFELVEKLATKYPDRPEVIQLRGALSTKLMETVTPVITRTATNYREVTRDQMVLALDSANNALALKKDDARIQAEAAYLRGVVALREWQVAGAASQAKAEGGAQGDTAGPAAARAEFENSLKLDDSLAAARYQLGVVLIASGDPAGAETALVKTTQQEPRWFSAYAALGSAYYGEGKFADSIAAYQKAISIEASNAAAIAGLGLARVMKGEKDGSKDIERAMKLDPSSALPHLNLAIVYSQSKNKKDWSRAEDEFKKAISMNPQNIEFQNSSAERLLAEVQKRKK